MDIKDYKIDNEALRARFNPQGSVLRRQQMRMLDILTAVDKICKKYSIRYWLSSGTLLGAMRHDGFIPWDDDLDIEMMREDYLRFLKVVAAELPADMALQSMDTDENFFYFYAKVRDRNSYMEELNHYDRRLKEKGIYIDVMPVERQPMFIHKLTEKLQGHVYKIWRTSTDDDKSMKKIRMITNFNRYVSYPLLRMLCNISGTKNITSGMGIPFHNPRRMQHIFPLTAHVFEGHYFPVPGNSDALLRGLYGDYMQLPDVDKINLHVDTIKFKEDK